MTRVLFPCTSVATANLPVSPLGRIDKRTISLKNRSYWCELVEGAVQRCRASVVDATALRNPYVHAARIVGLAASERSGDCKITSTSEFSLTLVSTKPLTGGNVSFKPCTISCCVTSRGLTGGFGSYTSGREIRRASR